MIVMILIFISRNNYCGTLHLGQIQTCEQTSQHKQVPIILSLGTYDENMEYIKFLRHWFFDLQYAKI